MPHDPACVFCQIVADTRKCVLLAEDPGALAFMDIHPANLGHCLVIPRGHRPTVFDIPMVPPRIRLSRIYTSTSGRGRTTIARC